MNSEKEDYRPRVIYKITNLLNGWIYIGQTVDFEKRTGEHKKGRLMYIDRAIRSNGEENFTFESICNCRTLFHALEMEKFFIEFYNTFKGPGYNLTEGGIGYAMTQDIKQKMSKSKQGKRPVGIDIKRNFLGVSTRPKSKFFTATCYIKSGKTKSKNFPTEIEAAEAYDKMALCFFGESAILNFPEKFETYKKCNLDEFYEFFLSNKLPRYSEHVGVTKRKNTHGELKWTVSFDGKIGDELYEKIKLQGGTI